MTERELMQMALNCLIAFDESIESMTQDEYEVTTALRARLAQPEPKNKALTHEELKAHNQKILDEFYKENAALYKPEPMAYLCENAVGHKYFRWKKPTSEYKPIALYTAPPQREWQGLTDEEAEDILKGSKNAYAAILAIEAKLKEKNGA